MGKNDYQRLAEKLSSDVEFATRIMNMGVVEATETLKKEGYNINEEGLTDFIEAAKKAIEEQKSELTEDELLQVSGGKKSKKIDMNAFGAGMVFGSAAVALGYAALVGIAIGCAW